MDMTPKEKAEELVNKYWLSTPIFFDIDDAKKCALIAVETVQNLCWGNNQVGIEHWKQVKHEIEKL